MATATKVETKEHTEVVVDTRLRDLVKAWKSKDNESGTGWMNIADYVVKTDTVTSKELKKALIDFRGLTENSAKSEASRFLRIRKSEEAQSMLKRALRGDKTITVYDLRSTAVKRGEKAEVDLQDLFERRFKSLAKFSIKEGLVEDEKEFTISARNAFKAAEADLEAKAAKATSTDEDESVEEDEEDEEAAA